MLSMLALFKNHLGDELVIWPLVLEYNSNLHLVQTYS